MSEKTQFLATVAKVQTLADNGLRFTLDVGEGEIVAAAEMMAYKLHSGVVSVTVEPHQENTEIHDNPPESTENAPKPKY